MPTARESLLNAALEAIERRLWPMVRMVEVAAAAGVSRQTLYNEFGDKAGLGKALVQRQIADLLDGFARRIADGSRSHSPDENLARATDWMLTAARGDRLVRACLTGCHGRELPPCPGGPGDLVAELTARAVRTLGPGMANRCETAVRLALSYVVAP